MPTDLEIVTRADWGAREPRSRTTIPTPTPELWLHHSAGNELGVTGVRRIQAFHMNPKPQGRNWSDIAYSHLIDRTNLTIYEGRGAGVQGGHTLGRNSRSHGICVMGNFSSGPPPDTHPGLLARIAGLVHHGHKRGWWPAQLTGGHRDVRSTSCPGDWLYRQIDHINTLATLGGHMPILANDDILAIQRAVNSVGYDPPLVEDGKAGPKTRAAVEDLLESRTSAINQLSSAQAEIDRLNQTIAGLREARDADVEVTAEQARKAADWDAASAVFARLVQNAGLA